MRVPLRSIGRLAASFLVTTAVAAGCSPETVTRPPPPPVDWASLELHAAVADAGRVTATDKERAASNAYVEALASRGFTGLVRVLDEEAHFSFAGFRDTHGRENVIKAHERLLGAVDDRHVVVARVLLTDSSQVIEWVMTGTVRASKKAVGLRGASLLWTKDDGEISDVHLYFDEAMLQAQLGTGPKSLIGLPPPPTPPEGWPEVEQARSATEGSNAAIVREVLEALENKNEAGYVGAMTEGVEITTPESAEPLRGRAAARTYMKTIHKSIGDLDTSIDNLWAVGRFVAVEYHIVGEQRGPIAWVGPQKDTLLKMFILDVIELDGGKISRIQRYDNPSQIVSVAP